MKPVIPVLTVLLIVISSSLVFAAASIENLLLSASSSMNVTSDFLNCSYSLNDTSTTAGTSWYKNGSSMMVLYMPMEGNMTNALLDYSGNGNNAASVGISPWIANQGYDANGAFLFNGTSYLDAGSIMPVGAYTKTAWVRFSAGLFSQNIISGDNNGHAFYIINDAGYRLEAGHNGVWNSIWDKTLLPENTWTFVAVTYDPLVNNGSLILYKNGLEVDSAANIGPVINDSRALIGSFNRVSILNGSIDDARIYIHALTPEQVREIYNNGGNTIVSAETKVGNEWQCRVTPFSSEESGPMYISNILTIIAEQASVGISNIMLSAKSPNNSTADDINCTFTLLGDSSATAWYKNGSSMMVLYMPMEGGETNALLDYSGNGNNAASVGITPWLADEGYDGKGAFLFNGTSYVDAGSIMPVGAYTKTAWVRFSEGLFSQNIISGDNNGHAFYIINDAGYRLEAGHNGVWNSVWDKTLLPENTWTFVAVTYDPLVNNGSLILYKNGLEVDSAANIGPVINDSRALIGSFNRVSILNGSIDDARIHAHALTREQIMEIYNNGGNTIVSAETNVGDEWQCRVTPFSSEESGITEASNILTILKKPSIELPIYLKKGWNLISIPLELPDPMLPAPLVSIEGNYSHGFSYIAADGRWDSYYAGEPASNKSLYPATGFWINMTQDDTLIVQGYEPTNKVIGLNSGWNLIGYPSLIEEQINDIFNVSEINSVFMFNDSNWYSYNSGRVESLNTLDRLIPGYGYWVNAK